MGATALGKRIVELKEFFYWLSHGKYLEYDTWEGDWLDRETSYEEKKLCMGINYPKDESEKTRYGWNAVACNTTENHYICESLIS